MEISIWNTGTFHLHTGLQRHLVQPSRFRQNQPVLAARHAIGTGQPAALLQKRSILIASIGRDVHFLFVFYSAEQTLHPAVSNPGFIWPGISWDHGLVMWSASFSPFYTRHAASKFWFKGFVGLWFPASSSARLCSCCRAALQSRWNHLTRQETLFVLVPSKESEFLPIGG